MAARIEGIFDKSTENAILSSKLLIVGAGGIGCELLKNLVLTGFENIHIIDLDTIDVSNLNRQFLFQKPHVGKSKATVARETALRFNLKANITAYHDSITNLKYDVDFYRQFSAVTNALDNIAARTHVNRMCLAADIPLIDSGSAGYLGQVTVYKKKTTECYECLPRPTPKTFPGCTIRNTPSEPIHCIVWAKHLFNQLFGEEDADEDVSPDRADKELDGSALPLEETGILKRVSTREWAKNCSYDPQKLFHKLFHEDIQYLLEMVDLWKKRTPPTPLDFNLLPDAVAGSSHEEKPSLADQAVWSMQNCADVFCSCISALKKRVDQAPTNLIWDKDDPYCLDFVTSCANIRAYCFHIPQKSRFDIKSMAGNIIPAVASTNAVVAGLLVLQLVKVLRGELDKCKTVYINPGYRLTKKMLSNIELTKPNPKCLVCSSQLPEVSIRVNIDTLTLRTLQDKILKEALRMVAPDAMVLDGKGTILISSDPEDMEDVLEKTLSQMKISYHARLQCDDFFQHSKLMLILVPGTSLEDQEFELVDQAGYEEAKANYDQAAAGDSISVTNDQEASTSSACYEVIEILATDSWSNDEENGTEPPTKKQRITID